MEISKETVDYVAHLARVELGKEELEKLSGQLKSIIDFIDKLKKADITGVEPTSHILSINNILRQDSVKVSLPIEKTLSGSPQKKENFFVVPKVIE